MFENRIDADEREFVNYDCMFQELPVNDAPQSQNENLATRKVNSKPV